LNILFPYLFHPNQGCSGAEAYSAIFEQDLEYTLYRANTERKETNSHAHSLFWLMNPQRKAIQTLGEKINSTKDPFEIQTFLL